jgi:two-component system chemotaxis response regulator CheB
MSKIKVLVVDDSAFSRQTIKNMLESDKDVEVVGIAPDGINAIAKTIKLKPDLITLDLEMPEMDGFSFLRWLMQQNPTPVIMVSSYGDSKTVFKALELGAVDFIAKPTAKASVELKSIEKDLLMKVKGVSGFNLEALTKARRLQGEATGKPMKYGPGEAGIRLVAIGASTGGPPALQLVLTELPKNFSPAVVISQHMPKGFTKSLAERLDKLCSLDVREAEQGDAVENGKVLVCPGGYHMSFKRRGGKVSVGLKRAVQEDMYAPSVDIMMRSAADLYGSSMLGVVLTGMGNDGTDGMKKVVAKGGINIAESEETAVVFGMPAGAIKAGVVQKVLPLDRIAGEIVKTVRGSGK